MLAVSLRTALNESLQSLWFNCQVSATTSFTC